MVWHLPKKGKDMYTLFREVSDMESSKGNNKEIAEQTIKNAKPPVTDHPEQLDTDKKSLLDRFESEQNVDPIPLEDLNIQQKDEKNKDQTKNSSSSPRKYKSGFE